VELDCASGARGHAGIDIVEDGSLREVRLERLAAFWIALDDSGQANGIAGGCAQFANDSEMIAAEGARADDGVADE
jgi:hypothetical protein